MGWTLFAVNVTLLLFCLWQFIQDLRDQATDTIEDVKATKSISSAILDSSKVAPEMYSAEDSSDSDIDDVPNLHHSGSDRSKTSGRGRGGTRGRANGGQMERL